MLDAADGYLLSAILLLAGGIAFVFVLLHVLRAMRRFSSVSTAVRAVWRGELLLLRARGAALRIAVRQRWPGRASPDGNARDT